MAERIDILTLLPTKLPKFTVNNGVPNVPVNGSGFIGDNRLYNAEGNNAFQQGDCFTILSSGIIMPLSFQFDRENAVVNPFIKFIIVADAGGYVFAFNEIGGSSPTSYTFGIMENYDTPLDIFIDVEHQEAVSGHYLKDQAHFHLVYVFKYDDVAVSMAGAPGTLNGTVQRITPYMKILHNFPMITTT